MSAILPSTAPVWASRASRPMMSARKKLPSGSFTSARSIYKMALRMARALGTSVTPSSFKMTMFLWTRARSTLMGQWELSTYRVLNLHKKSGESAQGWTRTSPITPWVLVILPISRYCSGMVSSSIRLDDDGGRNPPAAKAALPPLTRGAVIASYQAPLSKGAGIAEGDD